MPQFPLAPGSTIGILGGGQLGRMLAEAASRLGFDVAVLEREADSPAGRVCARLIVAAYDDAEGLKPTTLLVYGDSDMFEPEHIVRFWRLLGGGLRDGGWDGSGMPRHRLAILPGITHYEMPDAPALAETALEFLEE